MATLIDLARTPVRELNQALHAPEAASWRVLNPAARTPWPAGSGRISPSTSKVTSATTAAGMNQRATVTVHGNAWRPESPRT